MAFDTLTSAVSLSIEYAPPVIVYGVVYRLGRRLDLGLDALLALSAVVYAGVLVESGSCALALTIAVLASITIAVLQFLTTEIGQVHLPVGSLLIAFGVFKALEIVIGDSYTIAPSAPRIYERCLAAGIPDVAVSTAILVFVIGVLEYGTRTRLGLMFHALGGNPLITLCLPRWKVIAGCSVLASGLIGLSGALLADREGGVFAGFHLSRLIDAFIVAELTAALETRIRRSRATRRNNGMAAVFRVRIPITIQLCAGHTAVTMLSYFLLRYTHPSLPTLIETVVVIFTLIQFDGFRRFRLMRRGSSVASSLAIRGLTKVYRTGLKLTHVLRNAEFDFGLRGLWVVYGNNGSGKTTLLRLIADEIAPDRGSVEFASSASDESARLIRQDPAAALAINLSVRENLALSLLRRRDEEPLWGCWRLSDSQATQLLGPMGDTAGLYHALDSEVETLSGGRMQLLAVVCASISGSKVILADEPTKMLDAEHRRLVEQELARLATERLVLITTHEPRLDLAGPDRHVLVQGGSLIGGTLIG